MRVISDAFAEEETVVPSSFFRAKHPDVLVPKIKHSTPFQRTLSYLWKLHMNRGAAFLRGDRSPHHTVPFPLGTVYCGTMHGAAAGITPAKSHRAADLRNIRRGVD
jgi:hypothetical protein